MIALAYVQHQHIYSTKHRTYYKDVVESAGGTLIDVYLPESRLENAVLPHQIRDHADTYVFDVFVPHALQQELHVYFSVLGAKHLYTEHINDAAVVHSVYKIPHGSKNIIQKNVSIEESIAHVWKAHPMPVTVFHNGTTYTARSLRELERILLTAHLISGTVDVVTKPRGREYEMSFIRNMRDKDIYFSPLIQKVSDSFVRAPDSDAKKLIENSMVHIASALPHVPHMMCRFVDSGTSFYVTEIHKKPYTKHFEPVPSLMYVGVTASDITRAILHHHAEA